jgi:hypothetical protein
LLERLGYNHPRYADAAILQARMLENIAQTRLHGDSEGRRADRTQILDALNRLALEIIGVSFVEFAEIGAAQPRSAQPFDATPRSIGRSAGPSKPIHQLRPPVPDFVGRASEIAELVEALRPAAEHGTIGIIRGMGGLGKTQLACMVAQVRAQLPAEDVPAPEINPATD